MRLPRYSEQEIKEIEKEFEGEEGWVKADDVFGKNRKVTSVFVFKVPRKAKKIGKLKDLSELMEIMDELEICEEVVVDKIEHVEVAIVPDTPVRARK